MMVGLVAPTRRTRVLSLPLTPTPLPRKRGEGQRIEGLIRFGNSIGNLTELHSESEPMRPRKP